MSQRSFRFVRLQEGAVEQFGKELHSSGQTYIVNADFRHLSLTCRLISGFSDVCIPDSGSSHSDRLHNIRPGLSSYVGSVCYSILSGVCTLSGDREMCDKMSGIEAGMSE